MAKKAIIKKSKKKLIKKGAAKKFTATEAVKKNYDTTAANLANIGNQWWLKRAKHGRDKLFTSPKLLWEAAMEYFDDVVKNRNEYVVDFKTAGGRLKKVKKPLAVPFTWTGLCLYLQCNEHYFRSFRMQLKDTDPLAQEFRSVIDNISHIIYEKKFNGASNGIFNANLIAYDLGLRKDQQQTAAGSGISINISSGEDKKLIESVRNKLAEIDKLDDAK
jgi:hypothetical protein